MPEAKPLVIVESPAKARTIAGFLGKGYLVESSIGHIRDLPKNAADIPSSHRKFPWARLGVDVDHDFHPLYVVDVQKKGQIKKLKAALSQARELYLATDEDREGESIAWHLLEVLEPRVPVKRMVFHEITKKAIEHAIRHPRDLDRRLIDAQEARRILDRLYGYEVSPVLWKKIMPKLSAGRVQSVAIRMIVERERERIDFVTARYWDVEGRFRAAGAPALLEATLTGVDGLRVATGGDFGADGRPLKGELLVVDQNRAEELSRGLVGQPFRVLGVERKPHRRSPSPPFMTSTLQQEAARKLRFSAARTMRAAQRLYESGYITYMRTDSTTLSSAAVASAREQIGRMYGDDYLPPKPRVYSHKVKNAQEAHEAIRPAGDVFRLPDSVAGELGQDEARLYELIWMRTIASQMEDARGESVVVRIGGQAPGGSRVEFTVRGYTLTFPGFLRAYVEGSDDPGAELEQRERPLPKLVEGQELVGERFEPVAHETQPPPRYTEASLVRRLEELGVGRPSTYATILSTILERGYVWKKGTALVPSFTAFVVVALLKQYFGELVDYEFTARMEDELDGIANGVQEAIPWLRRFYFGEDTPVGRKPSSPRDDGASGRQRASSAKLSRGLHALVADQLSAIDARAINTLPLGSDAAGREIAVRVGRYGAYLQREQQTVRLGEEVAPDELTIARAVELFQAPDQDREIGIDRESGLPVLLRMGRFGAYVQLGAAASAKQKPKTASLLSGMKPEDLTLELALSLLSLPRTLGTDPKDGQPVTAQVGRYGAYVSKGSESRSLERDEQVFTVTLEQALEALAQPRQRRAKTPAGPLRELGIDPVSQKMVTLREGRFGPYVTDGETNASLRKGDSSESLTAERAYELLQERRDRGPAPRRPKRKSSSVSHNSRRPRTAKPTPKARTERAHLPAAAEEGPQSPKAGNARHAAKAAPSKARASGKSSKPAQSNQPVRAEHRARNGAPSGRSKPKTGNKAARGARFGHG